MKNEIILSVIVPVWNQVILLKRALESIPIRHDIEILIIDDGSTDGTQNTIKAYIEAHPDMRVRVFTNEKNIGLGLTKNVGYDNAVGKYVHQLDSDDYVFTDIYNKVIDEYLKSDADVVYFDLVMTNGTILHLCPETNRTWCGGSSRFIKRSFLGRHRCPDVRFAEDLYLNDELMDIPHTDYYTGLVGYVYNCPREGSNCDLHAKGLI